MKAMSCKNCIHNGECNSQPYCGGAWYERRKDETEAEERKDKDESRE